jgi:uncharacterized protein DUF1217
VGGIIAGINYNLLFAPDSSTNASAAILSILFSGSSFSSSPPTTFVSSGNPITDLKVAKQEQTAAVAQEALDPQVANALTAFRTAVKNATSIQSALLNPDVQQVLLTANGLSNYIGDTGMVQKLFLSDPSNPSSLVNEFGDSSVLSAVQSFDFAKNGLSELQNPKVLASLTNGYAEVMWRQSLDQATPGLANALSFQNQASSIKSVKDILDNETNFEVITTALGIPEQIVNQDTAAQTSAISSRLNISKLQDPNYVNSLTDQYLLAMQEQSSGSSGSIAGLLV